MENGNDENFSDNDEEGMNNSFNEKIEKESKEDQEETNEILTLFNSLGDRDHNQDTLFDIY